MNKSLHIGLVLPAVPGYSETFFRNKIIGLQKLGLRVTVFAAGETKGFSLCTYCPQPPVDRLFPLGWIILVKLVLLLLIKCPKEVRRLYLLERNQKKSQISSLKTILLNSHILLQQLDWIHFGFGTMAIGRENIAKAIGAKMAISHRGYDITIYPLKFPGCFKYAWEMADKIHVLSDSLRQKAISFGLPESKSIFKITPAINIKHFKTQKNKSYNELGKPLNILTVARLKWVKGLDYSLEALSLLRDQNIPFTYTIIGEGEEYERLVFAAHQLGLRDNVIFAGKQSPDTVKKSMEFCDIYLQYSISEGFCNAVLEAQAMGCLCVVSDAEGLPENILHDETGWVVPKRSSQLLSNQILEIIQSDADKIKKIRKAAIYRVNNEFNLRQQQEAFLSFYLD